jgi:hypothetical protein
MLTLLARSRGAKVLIPTRRTPFLPGPKPKGRRGRAEIYWMAGGVASLGSRASLRCVRNSSWGSPLFHFHPDGQPG